MCGICGWQWKRNNLPALEKRAVLATLLGTFNEQRGVDSYGWHDSRSGAIVRGVGRIGGSVRNLAPLTSAMIHTRHATSGDKTVGNAHPFSIGRIIGAHNGIIHNADDENKGRKKAGLKEFEVDSQHIFEALNERKDIKHLQGYGAIEWTDSEQGDKIFLCRISGGGDLAIAGTKYGTVWSSDKKHLEEALFLTGIKYDMLDVKANVVHYVNNGICYVSNKKLELGEWSYNNTPYGSRVFRGSGRPDEWEDVIENNWKKELVSGAVGEVKSGFINLSKRQRKRLIKQRNERLKESQGKSFSPLRYKDICKCGGMSGNHYKWCDEFKPWSEITNESFFCSECGIMKDKDGTTSHMSYCGKKASPVIMDLSPQKRPQVLGIMRNTEWVCSICCVKPQVDDQECPNGHGRVVGKVVDGQGSTAVV